MSPKTLSWENVVFCFYKCSKKEEKVFFLINLLIILAKFFIHKCKYSSKKSNFIHFLKDVEHYIQLIDSSDNKKAVKTLNICSDLDVFV